MLFFDFDIDAEIHIILGKPFLATYRALVDVEREESKYRVNEKNSPLICEIQ